jgi:glycosyltransferase involved in cell wall biosynthesis
VSEVFINGRYLTQAVTGVQRFALSIVGALDELADRGDRAVGGRSFTLLCPPGTPAGPRLRHVEQRHVGKRRGHLWEQLDLPRASRGGVLLSLGMTGPVAKRRQLVAIHDASAFAVPQAFAPGFRRWYRTLLPVLGRTALRVLTVSRFSSGELQRYAGIPMEKMRVVPNAPGHILQVKADAGIFERAGIGDHPYVLAVGNRSPHKNIDLVYQAMGLLGDTPCALVHAGDARPRIFGAVDVAPPERVILAGYVSDEELRALYERAECFIFPSIYEGFGVPPLEAMACGCPVIASNAASMPEVCGDAALYFDPRDAAALAARIAEMAASAELRREYARRGVERARRFTWEESAREVLRVLDEVGA